MQKIFDNSAGFQELKELKNVISDEVLKILSYEMAGKFRKLFLLIGNWTELTKLLEVCSYFDLIKSKNTDRKDLKDEKKVRGIYHDFCTKIASLVKKLLEDYITNIQKHIGNDHLFKKNADEIYKKAENLLKTQNSLSHSLYFKEFNKMSKLLSKIKKSSYNNEKELAKNHIKIILENKKLLENSNEVFLGYISSVLISTLNDGLSVISASINGNIPFSFSFVSDERLLVLDDKEFEDKNEPEQKEIKNKLISFTQEDLYGESGRLKSSDVAQMKFGDCALESVLQSLAKSEPDILKACISIRQEGGKTVIDFMFFPTDIIDTVCEINGDRKTLTFPATYIKAGNDPGKPKWPKVFEKGFALAKKRNFIADYRFNHANQVFIDGGNIYKKLGKGGRPNVYFTAITGKPYIIHSGEGLNIIKKSTTPPQELTNSNSVIGFQEKFWVPAIFELPDRKIILTPKKYKSEVFIIENHAYSSMGNGEKYINKHRKEFNNQTDLKDYTIGNMSHNPSDLLVLRNPHGCNTFRCIDEEKNEIQGCLYKASFLVWWNDIKKYLNAVNYEKT